MVGSILKKLREARGLTQQEAADKIGIKKRALMSYEADERDISTSLLSTFADFYGVSADYLLSRDGSDDIDPVEQLPVSLQDKAIVQAYISLPEKERSQLVGILRKIAEGADLSISLDGVEAVLKPPPEAEQNAQPLSEQPPEN